ncbi:MAG TPA: EAL domain-containing protein [Bacillota bacterium]|nr:EAL domain-containing protein [Bacillota bacterium]
MAKNNSKTETRIINETLSKIAQLEDSFNLLKENVLHGQELIEIGSWTYDIKEDGIYRSDGLYRILDCGHDDLRHNFKDFYKFVHPEDLEKVEEVDLTIWDGKESNTKFRIITPRGNLRYIHEVTKVIYGEDGKPSKVVGIMQNITETKQLEQKLKDSYESLDNAQGLAHIGSWEINHIENSTYWSDEAYRIHGMRPGQGENIFDAFFEKFVHPEDKEKILSVLSNPTRELTELEFKIIREDGSIRYIHQRMQFVFNDDNEVIKIQGTIQDITDKRMLEKQLQHKTNHDTLTGLPNRRYFSKYLKDLCIRSADNWQTFALMLFDIDNFKHINDSLGFQKGDELMVLICERLKILLTEKVFICRYSGNLFALIIEKQTSIDEYRNIAQRVIDGCSDTFRLDIYELDIAISMGVSVFPEDGLGPDQLLRNADIAKARARNEGKNHFKLFSRELGRESRKDYSLRRDLLYAIEKKELRLFYQPMVCLKTNKILAVEALIRWVHPVWGILLPNEFIHIAEETEFIISMGKWVLREACRTYKKWLEKGMPRMSVSVNFSGIQFLENNFADKIKGIIDEFGLDYSFLVMEITESVVMKRTDKVRSDIKKLQALGVKLALDDFGTGFSSLAYISTFKIDALKIDASFFHNLSPDSVNYSIVRFIAEMASTLDIQVVAEGIETADQLNEIKRLECVAGQGYIFSKPMADQDFIKKFGHGKINV